MYENNYTNHEHLEIGDGNCPVSDKRAADFSRLTNTIGWTADDWEKSLKKANKEMMKKCKEENKAALAAAAKKEATRISDLTVSGSPLLWFKSPGWIKEAGTWHFSYPGKSGK